MKFVTRILSLVFLLVVIESTAGANYVSVKNMRMWQNPEKRQIVFDISGPLEYRLFELAKPDRIVLDLDNARLTNSPVSVKNDDEMLADIRAGKQEKGLRIVLDLKTPVHPRTYLLEPAGQYGHRLVIDLYYQKQKEKESVTRKVPETRTVPSEAIIAIDAGHGGEDPGAIGKKFRTREKTVVLAIARELATMIRQEPGMRPVLIRKGDYYIGLKERRKKARRERATIFVSIHADAVPGRRARGSSVYALTERGATNRVAKFLADSESVSDQIGGVSLEDKDPLLRKVLVDLSQTANIPLSMELGQDILSGLKRVGHVHLNKVAQAGFAVLKAPDIPSVLVETAFISNPAEEHKLRTRSHQRNIARGIFRGIKQYLKRKNYINHQQVITAEADETTRRHTVKRGETLSGIAKKYQVNLDTLRFANNISGNQITTGSKLVIPR